MNLKIKKTPKHILDKNEIEGYQAKIKLKWGYLFLYWENTTKNKWNYEIIWNDPDNFGDNTIDMKKNQDFENKEDCFQFMIGIAKDYFEEHPIRIKIEENIDILKELGGF